MCNYEVDTMKWLALVDLSCSKKVSTTVLYMFILLGYFLLILISLHSLNAGGSLPCINQQIQLDVLQNFLSFRNRPKYLHNFSSGMIIANRRVNGSKFKLNGH